MVNNRSDWGVGRPGPHLSLSSTDGGTISLDDFRGHPLLLTFLSHAA